MINKKQDYYHTCGKCGSTDGVKVYTIDMSEEWSGMGEKLQLCVVCAKKLKRGIDKYVVIWKKKPLKKGS